MWVIVALTVGTILGAIVTIAGIQILPYPIGILISLIGLGCLGSCIYYLMKIYQAEKESIVSFPTTKKRRNQFTQ